MKLHFLGTGAGNFRGSRRQPSSALLENVLLDCGAGATGRLHDLGQFDRVDAVLVSHLHSDHVAGLLDFLLHTLITGRKRPLTVVSPPGLKRILSEVFKVHGTVVDPAQIYPFRLIEGERIETAIAPWTIRSVVLDHSILNLGYLLTSDGLSVFYSGDTREPSRAREVRTDYLIHEATFADRYSSQAKEYGHSTGSDAGKTATAMNARRLIINHIGGPPDSDAEIFRDASRAFPESVLAEDRMSFDL